MNFQKYFRRRGEPNKAESHSFTYKDKSVQAALEGVIPNSTERSNTALDLDIEKGRSNFKYWSISEGGWCWEVEIIVPALEGDCGWIRLAFGHFGD